MQLTDFARQLPQEVWELFEPLLPPAVWCGNGRPPASHDDCLHALCSVLVSGIAWRRRPRGFPSYKTVQRRLTVWLERDTLRTAWQQLAQCYAALQGLNWDHILLDGAKKPSKKGVNRRGRVPWSAGHVVRPSTEPGMPGPCRLAPWLQEPTPTTGGKRRCSDTAWWSSRRWQSSA